MDVHGLLARLGVVDVQHDRHAVLGLFEAGSAFQLRRRSRLELGLGVARLDGRDRTFDLGRGGIGDGCLIAITGVAARREQQAGNPSDDQAE